MKILLADQFYHDGRGPTLEAVHCVDNSSHLLACDFLNPDDKQENVKHLLFIRAQSYMFTPEEVANYDESSVDWSTTNNAAIVSLGRSPWLMSFDQRHLQQCEHFRVMFYDEVLDVVCEGIEVRNGRHGAQQAIPAAGLARRARPAAELHRYAEVRCVSRTREVGVPDEFHFKLGKGKWGINLDAVECPDCKQRMPKVRIPDNLHRLMWGGWTCPQCGCRMDKWGKALARPHDDEKRA